MGKGVSGAALELDFDRAPATSRGFVLCDEGGVKIYECKGRVMFRDPVVVPGYYILQLPGGTFWMFDPTPVRPIDVHDLRSYNISLERARQLEKTFEVPECEYEYYHIKKV